MKDIKKILFPVDLSEPFKKIIPYVHTMANRLGAEIHLLYVVRGLEYFTDAYLPLPPNINFEDVIEGAQKNLYDFKDEYFKDLPDAKATVVSGNAAKQIINYIESEHVEMIIMGTHGRKGLDKAIFGSVAERVVKTAPVPVMVVNTFQEE